MTNKNLLQEAIAEAKTIREAAIANAKEALEETLTPHLKEMLAHKLQEMEDLDEEDTVATDNAVDGFDKDHGNVSVNEEEEEEEAPEEDEENPEDEDEKEEEDEEDLDPNDPDFADKLKDLIRDIVAHEVGENESEEEIEELPAPEGDIEGTEDDNQIDIDELLSELAEMNEEEVDEYGEGGAAGNFSGYSDEGELDKLIAKIAEKTGKGIDAISNFLYGGESAATPEMKGFKESTQTQQDLQEALAAVKTLRNQLQEVNLLNAKLLYVNKVFKSNNLTESQKVDVIATFDKAETVREVKLVFETVSKNVVTKRPTAIKEHLSFASKATGNAQTTAPKEIISEVSDQVKRMQFLAGIKTN